MKFNLKLHQCCANDELRPSMEHVYFDGEKIIATNAHILVVVDMDDLNISDPDKKLLKGKFIHRRGWQKIWNKEVSVTKTGFDCPDEYITVPFAENTDWKFPDWKSIMPELGSRRELISRIGIKPEFLNILASSIPCNGGVKELDLYFSGEIKGIIAFNKNVDLKSYGLIMPSRVNRGVDYLLDRSSMNYKTI